MKLAVFIDYDNLLEPQKTAGILGVVTRALLQLPSTITLNRGSCDVRIYGGWYEGTNLTPLAERLAAGLQKEFPTIVRVPRSDGDAAALQVTAALALALLEDPSHLLFNTYRKKGKPSNLRVQLPATVGCNDPSCPLPAARKLLKSGQCPIGTCVVTADDLVYRHEQKIVDTMLACDLVYASRLDYSLIILISGDDDFIPSLRTLVVRGSGVIRYHTRPNSPRAPSSFGASRLIELEL